MLKMFIQIKTILNMLRNINMEMLKDKSDI